MPSNREKIVFEYEIILMYAWIMFSRVHMQECLASLYSFFEGRNKVLGLLGLLSIVSLCLWTRFFYCTNLLWS